MIIICRYCDRIMTVNYATGTTNERWIITTCPLHGTSWDKEAK
jgi:hypothetical protein